MDARIFISLTVTKNVQPRIKGGIENGVSQRVHKKPVNKIASTIQCGVVNVQQY